MILHNDRFIEGHEVSINIEDRGYQFGDGVYEVVRVYDGVCFQLDAHIQRLKQSANKIMISLPFSTEEIKEKLLHLVQLNNLQNGNIYLQISRGVAPRIHHFPDNISAVMVAYTQEVSRPIEMNERGIHAILTEDIRWHRCDIKSLNLLGNVLAKQEAKEHGSSESILHRGNTVTEGSSTNVFVVKDSVIYTHPANNLILNGITRVEVIRLAKEDSIKVIEEAVNVDDLIVADEVFVTSTTMEIAPVIKIGQHVIGTGCPGPITKMLQSSFEQMIMKSRQKV